MILSCDCGKPFNSCTCVEPIKFKGGCECPKERKIPAIERKFIYAQRFLRLGRIGGVDRMESERLTKRLERKEQNQMRADNPTQKVHVPSTTQTRRGLSSQAVVDSIPQNHPTLKFSASSQMRLALTSTATTSARFGVSDRATAAIVSSVLHDIGLVTEEDTVHVVDKSKIRRERQKISSDLKKTQITEIEGLYYDGRKDETAFVDNINSKRYRKTRLEEHISLIAEPGPIYVAHVAPKSGKAKDKAESIVSYFVEKGIDTTKLKVLGADGEPTNTGWQGGSMREIELKL